MKGAAQPGGKGLVMAACLWLALPFAIFALGWLKLWLALPVVGLLGVCLWLMARHAPGVWVPALDRKALLKLGLVALLIIGWVLLAGVGRFGWQNEDHSERNALFRMLVEQPWPVVDLAPPAEVFDQPVALVYYFGFWLPAAAVGKLFGMLAGNLAQVLWAALGILLFYLLALGLTVKKMAVWPLVVFVLFSGMDILGCWLTGSWVNPVGSVIHLERWANPFQFSSMSTQLFWVYNQAVPAWLCTVLLLVQKNNRCLVLICALSLLCSTLPFIGLLPVAAWVSLRNLRAERPLRPFPLAALAKSVLTVENLLGGGVVGILSALFLASNNAAQGFGLRTPPTPGKLLLWLAFLVLEVGVLAVLLWRYHKKDPLFYIALGCLALFPWLAIGNGGDFGMRGTIPALVVLWLAAVDALDKDLAAKKWKPAAALLAVLAIGAVTAKNELLRPFTMDEPTAERHPYHTEWRDNFYGNMEGRFFFEYLMRR